MKPQDAPIAHDIEVAAIRPLIRRARDKEGFAQLKASMAEVGLKIPIQVRDFGRKDEKGHRYELICGEGRMTAARQLGWEKIPALIIEAAPEEIAGRFLAENMIRRPLPWAEKGRLIREEIARGFTLPEVAKRLFISIPHASKYLRVLRKTAEGLEDEVVSMPMNDAEIFTTLPAKNQKIVMEVIKSTGEPMRQVIRAARDLQKKEGEGWTKASLEKAIRGIEDDLTKARNRARLLRLHHALGPGNLRVLLRRRDIRNALASAKVSTLQFEETSEL
jgi:ParB family transcriptional regulator, chromosome partitioning protein